MCGLDLHDQNRESRAAGSGDGGKMPLVQACVCLVTEHRPCSNHVAT